MISCLSEREELDGRARDDGEAKLFIGQLHGRRTGASLLQNRSELWRLAFEAEEGGLGKFDFTMTEASQVTCRRSLDDMGRL